MGSNSSRPGSRTSRTRPNSRSSRFFSSLICGGSSSSRTARHEMEDYPDKILMNSAEHCCPVIEVQNSAEESSVVSNTVTGSRSSVTETGGSSGNSIRASEGTSVKYGYRNLDTNSRGKCLSDSKELVGPDQVSGSHDESGRNISIAEASTSFKERQSSDPVPMNASTNMDSVNGIENSENEGFSQIYPDIIHTSSSNSLGHGDSCSNGLPFDNHSSEVTDMPNSNSDSVNHRSNVPVTFRSTQDESIQDPVPSDLGLLVPNREQGRTDGSVLHVDVVSISSSIYSSSNSDTSSREARRNSRRLFRDAFSRRSSRRHVDSPTIVFSTDNTDDLESHDRWLLDFSGDFFDDGIGSDSGYMSRRIHRLNERRRHSRSEIWERLRGGLDENGRRTTSCPSGLHPDGTCSCESFLMAEESSARGSISRIVMLAEALFEVLDEIHRQPVSLSLSMMSLPAPGFAVGEASCHQKAAMSSMASKIKAYSVPVFLFSLSVFYQLVVLPRFIPASHYDVLGIKRYSSVEEVKEAYDEMSSTWNSEAGIPATSDFIKIQYAYELLTNPLWKRDYDIFGIDEQAHIMDKINLQYAGESISGIELPLLEATTFDLGFHTFNEFTSQEFAPMFDSSKPWLVLVYSLGSKRCAQFFSSWIDITGLLDGVAGVGILELGELQLAISLAERKPTGKFFFRNGLPSLVAFPSGCKASACLVRFEGDLSTDAVIDWFATKVLGLPRILYYSKESLGQNFLAKSGPHKVKVIFFSKTGARATPFVRQTAKSYWAYTSFAFVLWREEDFSVWWNAFEVESAPAIVFVKDSGVKPVVVHGMVNNSEFLALVEKNKQQELPQLRSATSMELGCDARGHSRAGNDTISWYCVILAGRLGPELNKMREIMRRIQERLSIDSESSEADEEQPLALTGAFKGKRLTFTWLDGEAQEKYCSYYLHSETSYDTCGPRRDLIDVPKLFIVRYKRNASEDDIKVDTKPKNIFNVFEDEDVDPASQLVARYNGSDEISQIMLWMSEIIMDGDTRNLPFYRSKTPALVPEDSEPIWSRGAQSIFSKSIGIKQRIYNNISRIYDYLGDPRIGPILLLGALMSFGTIWLIRSQSTHPTQASQLSQSNAKDETRERRRDREKHAAKKDRPPSITDSEPKGAYQMPLSDSESE